MLILYSHTVPLHPTLTLHLCILSYSLSLYSTLIPYLYTLPSDLTLTLIPLYPTLIPVPYPLLTSPRNSLSSSRTRAWSHSVISSIRSLNSRLCTGEYMNVWVHLGSSDFFTVFVLLLLLSLNGN